MNGKNGSDAISNATGIFAHNRSELIFANAALSFRGISSLKWVDNILTLEVVHIDSKAIDFDAIFDSFFNVDFVYITFFTER